MKWPRFKFRLSRKWLRRGIVVLLCGIAFVAYTYAAASSAARGKTTRDVDALPHSHAGLVFGCSPKIGNRENLYFRYRIDAAVKLWEAGKVDCLIVSGDNRTRFYNEPIRMREALMARGVPGSKIVCDFAGLSTLDSVVRAKEIFGLHEVIFVTQQFHNERAIYLARAQGMEAQGLNTEDVALRAGWKTRVREIPARVKMWLDVHVLKTRPHHGGEPVELPL